MNLNFSLKDSKQKEVHLENEFFWWKWRWTKISEDRHGEAQLQSMDNTLDVSFRHGTSIPTTDVPSRCTGAEAVNGDLHTSEQGWVMRNDGKEVLPSFLCLFRISSIYQVHRVLLQYLALLAQGAMTWKYKTSFWVLSSKAGLAMAEFCLELGDSLQVKGYK